MKQPNRQLAACSLACGAYLLLCVTASAQLSVGIEGGYNKNYLLTNNANRAFTNYQPLNGFSIGIPVQYKISDWFAIAADPSFVKKNYTQQRSAFFAGVFENTYNSYVQLPVMGHFMFGGKRLQGFLNAGLYGGYWQGSHVKGTMPNILNTVDNSTESNSVYDYENPYNYDEKYNFDSRKDNRFEAGWITGIGISYNVNERYQVFTEGRLLYSFTDQQKNYESGQVPRYNSTYGINVGLLYHFSLLKSSN